MNLAVGLLPRGLTARNGAALSRSAAPSSTLSEQDGPALPGRREHKQPGKTTAQPQMSLAMKTVIWRGGESSHQVTATEGAPSWDLMTLTAPPLVACRRRVRPQA